MGTLKTTQYYKGSKSFKQKEQSTTYLDENEMQKKVH